MRGSVRKLTTEVCCVEPERTDQQHPPKKIDPETGSIKNVHWEDPCQKHQLDLDHRRSGSGWGESPDRPLIRVWLWPFPWKQTFVLHIIYGIIHIIIEFVCYIKGSISVSPKASNQLRCHFPRFINCLCSDAGEGQTRFPLLLRRRGQPHKLRPTSITMSFIWWLHFFPIRSTASKRLAGSAQRTRPPAAGVRTLPHPSPVWSKGQSSSRSLSRSMNGSSM